MKIAEATTEPSTIQIQGQPPQTVRQKLTTFKISNKEDMAGLTDELAKGRDIILQTQAGDTSFVILRELVPVKIALPTEKA